MPIKIKMETTIPIYDKELSLQLAGGNTDLAEQMLEMLLKELPLLCEQAKQAAVANDNEALFTHVHKINGSTRYIGVPALGATADELELEIKAGSSHVAEALQRMTEEVRRLIALQL